MSLGMSEPQNDPYEPDDAAESEPQRARMPFDISDIDKLPRPNDSDPPYRPFWIVSNDTGES